MKVITIDSDRCTGCRLCELACSLKKTGEFNPARSRIHVAAFDETYARAVVCSQCRKPYCAEVCPTGAIVKEEGTGIVRVIAEECVGCRMCTDACPWGDIAFSPEDGVAVKCDLCDGSPECVSVCVTRALEFREVHVAVLPKTRALAEKLRTIDEGTKQ